MKGSRTKDPPSPSQSGNCLHPSLNQKQKRVPSIPVGDLLLLSVQAARGRHSHRRVSGQNEAAGCGWRRGGGRSPQALPGFHTGCRAVREPFRCVSAAFISTTLLLRMCSANISCNEFPHKPSVCRSGGLHLPGRPGDGLAHRKAAEEALCHRLPGVRAQHCAGLHQTGQLL